MTERTHHALITGRKSQGVAPAGWVATAFALLLVFVGLGAAPVAGAQPTFPALPRALMPDDVLLSQETLSNLAMALEKGTEPPYTTRPVEISAGTPWFISTPVKLYPGDGYGEATAASSQVNKVWWDGNHMAQNSMVAVLIQQVPRSMTARGACRQRAGNGYTLVTVNASTCYVKWSREDFPGWDGTVMYVTTPKPGVRIFAVVSYWFPRDVMPKAISAAKAIATAQAVAAKALR